MYSFLKRFGDILISMILILLLSPLYIILIIIVSVTSPGGPFFCGERIGKNGKPFKIIKFRSMIPNCEGKGKWNIGDNDNRITKVGHFLRNSKLDELPQLFCVFIGKMSFVGPRPELKYYVDMYKDDDFNILKMKPGITDWATLVNIKQFKEFTKSSDPDEYYVNVLRPLKLKLQKYYFHHHSIFGDISIMFLTFFKTVTRSGYLPKKIKNIVDEYKETLKQNG